MKVFELNSNGDDFRSIDSEKDLDLDMFNGASLKNQWEPFEVFDYNKKKKSDTPNFLISFLVISQKCKEKLENILKDVVEFLPLIHSREKYWVLNVINIQDVIDLEKSIPVRLSSGLITHFEKYEFISENLENQLIFKTPEHDNRINCTDKLKEIIENAGLTGFVFKEIWNSEVK